MVGHVQQKAPDLIHVSIPASLCFGHLCNWETHGGKYGLQITVNLHLYGHEKAIKLDKK